MTKGLWAPFEVSIGRESAQITHTSEMVGGIINELIDESIDTHSTDPDITTESYRQLVSNDILNYYEHTDYLSNTFTTESAGHPILKVLKNLLFLDIIISISTLGIIIKHSFRGFVYGMSTLSAGLYYGIVYLDRQIERKVISFSRLNKEVHELKTLYKEISQHSHGNLVPDGNFNAKGKIEYLTNDQGFNPKENIKDVNKFMETIINSITLGFSTEIQYIKRIATTATLFQMKDPITFLKVDNKFNNLQNGEIDGYEKPSTFVEARHSKEDLPGGRVLIYYSPPPDLLSVEEYRVAYSNSNLFMGIKRDEANRDVSLGYLSLTDLGVLINELEGLCTNAIKNQRIYSQIKKDKLSLKTIYRSYYESLIKSKNKITPKNSYIDVLNLRNKYMDKVYVPGMIDVHDYVAKVISAYVGFCKSNLHHFKQK